MLRKIAQAAYLNPEWRRHLVPLVKMGSSPVTDQAAGLRSAVIRTAFTTCNPKLRTELVRIVKAYDAGDIKTGAEYARLLHIARGTKDPQTRRRVAHLLRQAKGKKYEEAFLKWVEPQDFPNPEYDRNNPHSKERIKFVSLSRFPEEQAKIRASWMAGKKEWAQKHKPKGFNLDKESLLTAEKFDAAEIGDLLWLDYSPVKLHKVTGRGKTRGGKATLELVQVDAQDHAKEGASRTLHRSQAGNPDHEIHILPRSAPQIEEKDKAPERHLDEPDSAADMPMESDPPKPAPKKAPAKEPVAPKPAEPEKEPEVPKAAPTGKHKDRKELLGLGRKKMADKANVDHHLRGLLMPKNLPSEQREHAAEELKDATYELIALAHSNAVKALAKPDGKIMRNLKRQGYTPEGVQELHDALTQKMHETKGRRYSKTVLDIANQYDLEGEDADELYNFKHGKPWHGQKLTPQQLMQKFLAKAKPETRERMKGMQVADFMAMYNAIMADDEEIAIE